MYIFIGISIYIIIYSKLIVLIAARIKLKVRVNLKHVDPNTPHIINKSCASKELQQIVIYIYHASLTSLTNYD